MTTMLEKMAAAIWEEFRKPGDPLYSDLGPVAEERLSNLARAALQAIRGPGLGLGRIGADEYEGGCPEDAVSASGIADAFTAMIDAILAEDKA